MRCDSCQRERTDEQMYQHPNSGVRFCRDREECHAYRTRIKFEELARELMNMIEDGGLIHGEGTWTWSLAAWGMIAVRLREAALTPPARPGQQGEAR